MRPRHAYDAVKRRITGYLEQVPRRREAEAWARRRSPDDALLFIVAEKDMPYRFAPFMYAEWLDWLAEEDPGLRARIELAHIPAAMPANTAVFHAWVRDPVRERNGVLFAQLQDLQARAEHAGASVVQPVEALSNSLRDIQYERLTRAGLRTPRVVPVGSTFAQDLGGLSLPIIVRRNWGHQQGMLRLDSESQVARWLESVPPGSDGWVASEFTEVRSADGDYRKHRYVMFGDRGVCRHLIVSPNWEVRPKERVLTDEAIAEELEFVNGSCEQHALFDAARRELGFDIAAFDYSFDTDGEMVVWEVNPFPDLSRPRGRPGEYLEDSIRRGNEAFAALYRDRFTAAEEGPAAHS